MESPASTCIIGRIGVNAKRPTPIGTARATMPASAMTSGDDARAGGGGTSQPVRVSRGATAFEERTGPPGALRAMGGWGPCRGPPSLRHDAQDLVVALARAAAAVAVAGRDVERAVGADDDVAQPAVHAPQDRPHVDQFQIGVERDLDQPLAAQRRHPHAVAKPGDARWRPRVALGLDDGVHVAAARGRRIVGPGDVGPAVILAGLDAIDLVVSARAVLGGEEPPLAVPREALRIAM